LFIDGLTMYNSQSAYESLADVCVNSAMANIRTMTVDQLNDLLYNESRLDALIDNLPQIRSLPTEREAGLAQNKSLAEWNLAQEPKLNQLRTQVKALHAQAVTLRSEVESLKAKLDEVSSSKSLDTTSNLLQVAAQEADDDAENTTKAFLAGTIPAEQFLKDLLEKKTLAHIRKIKSDRLITILRDQQYAQAAPPLPPRTAPYPDLPAGPSRRSFY
uniref:Modifier of rudimentary domain containing protein n=1 Tax=Haemonchus contortus TaxID=6289 RepID=A0A7I4YYU1_HAECO